VDFQVDGVGDVMQPVKIFVLFILLGQAISVPVVALFNTGPIRQSPHVVPIKKQMKQQKKMQMKVLKFQRRAEKRWKKQHHVGH
jgi:hypothetical protein